MTLLIAALFLIFASRRLFTYLHIFQQEEYDGGRFLYWLWRNKALDRRASIGVAAAAALSIAVERPWADAGAAVAVSLIFLFVFLSEPDPRKNAKKKLVMTSRAQRIYGVAAALVVLEAVFAAIFRLPLLLWIVPVQLIPFSLPVAAILTSPLEKKIQKKYWTEAHEKLLTLKPVVIAVTGSFGKTTLKHILGHVLETTAQVLATPGSVNTPMGIARIIRERLAPHHKYFVCEMGAYGPGSIARLCKLAPPSFGVITAVGPAHYERFKSLDAVAKTKFELADAVIDANGKVVINSETLAFAYPQDVFKRHKTSFISVGKNPADAIQVLEQTQTADGIEVAILWNGERRQIKAPLFGEHQAQNLALSFAVAAALGLQPDQILRALSTTPQIPHRLEVKRQPNGVVIIDDAYNSNPVGFASGLRVLNALRAGDGRRIVATPGMVELGAAHDDEHRKIGQLAAQNADMLLAIKPERIASLVDAFQKSHADGALVTCESFSEARLWMEHNTRAGDIILIENDLPDLYESKLRL